MFGEKNGRNYQHSRNSAAGQALTIPAALSVTAPYPASCGVGVPLRKDVSERHKIIFALDGVDALGHGNQPDVPLP